MCVFAHKYTCRCEGGGHGSTLRSQLPPSPMETEVRFPGLCRKCFRYPLSSSLAMSCFLMGI